MGVDGSVSGWMDEWEDEWVEMPWLIVSGGWGGDGGTRRVLDTV